MGDIIQGFKSEVIVKTNVVSLSGGKDSCATALLMKEKKIRIDFLVHVDVGKWEFKETKKAVKQVQKITGAKLITLKPVPFDYWMFERLVIKKDGSFMIGSGWPSRQHGRWCTREKFVVFDKFMKTLKNPVKYVGFAYDEKHRINSIEQLKRKNRGEIFKFPLIKYKITEEQALKKCYDYGINWNMLYEKFRVPNKRCPRLSCWCCPHQPLTSLRVLKRDFPKYWKKMLKMDKKSPQRVFRGCLKNNTNCSVEDLEKRFNKEGI